MSEPNAGSLGADHHLIAAAAQEADKLRSCDLGSSTTDAASIPPIPGGIPGYDILREIHRGGQGVVYQAMHKGTRRKVAIKVLREGPFAGAKDRARFEREMHILAQLSDPHIVAIHDSGAIAGNFYYVMDYISGPTLDLYMASRPWTIREILQLFVRICDAVAAAHVRGIIHRDIKPANIRIDARGEPRVLDFGLAKIATGDAVGDSNPRMVSMTGEFIGSLPWASPEQAEGISSQIDTRTDVYSLGVTLFQMLSGTFPYPVVGGMRDVLDNILHAQPIRPRTIRKDINDEVETIVLKCLAKERERRYQSAGELGRDVTHYLAGEPIEAKRDSGWYVLRKALARHRGLVAAVAVVFLLTAGFAVTMSVLYRESESRRQRATKAERIATIIQQFLQTTLAGADPEESAPNMQIKDVLDRAAARVGRDFKNEPEVEAAVQHTIGDIYLSRNLYDQAERHLQRAIELRRHVFGEQSLEHADSLHRLGAVYWRKDDVRAAEPLYRKALDIRLAIHGPYHRDVADSHNHVAACLQRQGRYDEAERLFREALNMRRALPETNRREIARSLNNLAGLYREQGRFSDAEQLYQEALAEFRNLQGPEHQDVARVLGSLGVCMLEAGRCDGAKRYLLESLDMKKTVSEPRDLSVAHTQHYLAKLLLVCDPPDLIAAERQCREALLLREEKQPVEHRDIGESLCLLGAIQYRMGKPDEAMRQLDRADAILRKTCPANHWLRVDSARYRGACLISLGRFESAEQVLLAGLDVARQLEADRKSSARDVERELVRLYESWGKPEKALALRPLPPRE